MKYMCRNHCILLIIAMSVFVVACSRSTDEPLPADDGMVDVDWVLYEEQEPEIGQYAVRILVSPQYLRLDDDYDESDFLLLDRHSRTLFSVSHMERSILVIDSQPGDAGLPPEIVLTEDREEYGDAPKISGRLPLYIRFKANDELCYEAFVIAGVQEKVTGALTEYLRMLGLRELHMLDSVPEAQQTPCFLSRYVYRPARHLLEGLPVREWDADGYQRTLVDFGEKRQVSRTLFELPDDYTRSSID